MGIDSARLVGVIRAVMRQARAGGQQKQLGHFLREGLPQEARGSEGPGYPSRGTVSRWVSESAGDEAADRHVKLRMPAAALVMAMIKVRDAGGSIDRLLGGDDEAAGRVASIEARLDGEEGLEGRVVVLETVVSRLISELRAAGVATEVDMIDKPGDGGAKIQRTEGRGTT